MHKSTENTGLPDRSCVQARLMVCARLQQRNNADKRVSLANRADADASGPSTFSRAGSGRCRQRASGRGRYRRTAPIRRWLADTLMIFAHRPECLRRLDVQQVSGVLHSSMNALGWPSAFKRNGTGGSQVETSLALLSPCVARTAFQVAAGRARRTQTWSPKSRIDLAGVGPCGPDNGQIGHRPIRQRDGYVPYSSAGC